KSFGIERVVVTTLQALSGASYPGVASLDALDNVVPFIAEEEEKMEQETKKFLGAWNGQRFVPAEFVFSAHCNRVSVRDGHTDTVSMSLRGSPSVAEVKERMREFRGRPQELALPTAPKRPVIVREERDRPQPLIDRDVEGGMAAVVGRVQEDAVLGIRYGVLMHNTIRGARPERRRARHVRRRRGLGPPRGPVRPAGDVHHDARHLLGRRRAFRARALL